MIADDAAPGTASKIGLDCTIPISPNFVRSHFDRSTVFELGDPPPGVMVMSEEELTADMAAFIREAPPTWKEVLQHCNGLQHYNGQPYRTVYGAFSNLRHQLGRCDDEPWYRYTYLRHRLCGDRRGSSPTRLRPSASGLSSRTAKRVATDRNGCCRALSDHELCHVPGADASRAARGVTTFGRSPTCDFRRRGPLKSVPRNGMSSERIGPRRWDYGLLSRMA